MVTEAQMETLIDGLAGFEVIRRWKTSDDPPGAEALDVLDALERSLVAIHNKEVTTSIYVSADHLRILRQLRAIVDDWNQAGKRPVALPFVADDLLVLHRTPEANMVRREFQFTPDDGSEPRPIVLIIYSPARVEGHWALHWEIAGFAGMNCPTFYGADSMDVFLRAIQFADVKLRELAKVNGGTLIFEGRPQLGLVLPPVGWRAKVVRAIAVLFGEESRR